MTGVCQLHFSPPHKHARHYLGYADDIGARVAAHRARHGARLTQVAVDAGCTLVLARMWPETNRTFERELKDRKHAPRLCPACNQVYGQLDLLTSLTLADVEELQF